MGELYFRRPAHIAEQFTGFLKMTSLARGLNSTICGKSFVVRPLLKSRRLHMPLSNNKSRPAKATGQQRKTYLT